MIFYPRNLKWVKDSISSASSITQAIAKSDFIIYYYYIYSIGYIIIHIMYKIYYNTIIYYRGRYNTIVNFNNICIYYIFV